MNCWNFANAGCTAVESTRRPSAARRSRSVWPISCGNFVKGVHIGERSMSVPAKSSNIFGTVTIASCGGIQPLRMPSRRFRVSWSSHAGYFDRRLR